MTDTYTYPTLFNLPQGLTNRDIAIAAAEAGAPDWWKTAAHSAIVAVASRMPEFTSDDIWEELHQLGIPSPDERRAMGPLLIAAAVNHLIISTPRTVTSRRPVCHGRKIQVWRSLCVEGM